MKSLKSQNFYEVLGVPRHATAEEIRAAYEISRHTFQENSLATYSLFTDAENEEILGLISKAYETLFNPEMRRAYDSQLDRAEPDMRPQRRPMSTPTPTPQPAAPVQQMTFASVRRPVEELEARPAPIPTPPPMPAPTMTPPQPVTPSPSPSMQSPMQGQSSPGPAARTISLSYAPDPRPTPPRPAPPSPAPREPNPQAVEFVKTLVCFDGASLKKLRQLHGLSLEELSERTKIRRAYLEYLEEEQFKFLPAAVYVKGFISILAGILGVPPQRAAEDYMTRYSGVER